jgi:prevent-host-death family protein
MTEVGIRELRDHLSRYLDRIQRGEEAVITDRGRAIARVVPMSGERTIDRLIREGKVTPSSTRTRTLPTRVTARGPVSTLVGEQRR